LPAGRTWITIVIAVVERVAILRPIAKNTVTRTVAVVGRIDTSARPRITAIVGTTHAVVAVTVDQTVDTAAVDRIAQLPAGRTGITIMIAVVERVAILRPVAKNTIIRTVGVVGRINTGARARIAVIIGTTHAVVAVTGNQTVDATVVGPIAQLPAGRAGIAGRITIVDYMAELTAIAENAVIGAVAVVGRIDT
jgi:hypothetical protein